MKVSFFVAALFLFLSIDKTLDQLPLNKIQVIGSHNSYKEAIDPALFAILLQKDSAGARSIEYSHAGLSEQLSMGLQNLEIDIYADVKGGKYASPKGLTWVETSQRHEYDPGHAMADPGFKVLHMQDVDFRSNCLTFKNCLQELKAWSDQHKNHYPVFVTINAKDDLGDFPGFTVPEKFTAEVFDRLDNVIIESLGKDKILVPDEIRGKSKTLESSVLNGSWPMVAAAKGKFIFILDETGEKRDTYIKGHPSLERRVLFVNAAPGTPEAAFLIMNNPLKDSIAIKQLVMEGYIVRTRADADTEEARRNDKTRFYAACRTGAQIITTDYYRKSVHFKSAYTICFDGGKYIRKNPVLNK